MLLLLGCLLPFTNLHKLLRPDTVVCHPYKGVVSLWGYAFRGADLYEVKCVTCTHEAHKSESWLFAKSTKLVLPTEKPTVMPPATIQITVQQLAWLFQ